MNERPDSYRWVMLGGVWLIYFCFGLTIAAMAPLIQPIVKDLGLSLSAMGIVLGAWPLFYIAAAIPAGAAIDRFGVRRVLLVGAFAIGASSLLRAFASDFMSLFLAVATFGLGGPMISIGAPKLISQWFDGRERGTAVGIYITGPSIGGITALALTNSVLMPLTADNWRAVLIIYSAVAFSAGLLWLAIVSHPRSKSVERQTKEPQRESRLALFFGLYRLPTVKLLLAMGVGTFFFNHGLFNWLPEILRSDGMDPISAGYWASIPAAFGILGALIIPRLALPSRRVGLLMALFVAGGISTLMIQNAGPALLALALAIQGVARSSMTPLVLLLLMEAPEVGSKNMGAAGGLFFSAAEVGGVLGPLTIGYLADLTGGFAASLWTLSAVCGLLFALALVLRVRL